ncbi:MAG: hypothetical protein ABL866_14715 [Devosia sp.]
MNITMRKLLAMAMAVGMGFAAGPAMAEEELIGIFQTPEGGMDYRATLCGDGTQLCLQLVALHGKGDTKGNRKHLGEFVVRELPAAGANKWRGVVTIKDKSANGVAAITPGKQLYVSLCAYVVVCADLTLHYVGTGT